MASKDGFTEKKWENLNCRDSNSIDRTIALVGCGNYCFSNIAFYLAKENPKFLRYAYDINESRSRSLCERYSGAFAVSDWQVILDDPIVDLVFIASNHASHAQYAIDCIRAGKNVHIEKPHVVSEEQLSSLLCAMNDNPNVKVFLGFNRPRSQLFLKLKNMISDQTGALMINWFIAGHEIADDHWYFSDHEGGRVLGNLCHWTDLCLHLVGLDNAFPCKIVPSTPKGSRSDFVVSVQFADNSCVAITFSAKGHTFEGVSEILNIHKGNVLANITNFKSLTVDVVEKRIFKKGFYRDHGHAENFLNSYRQSRLESGSGEDLKYIRATAKFFLAIRHAIENGETIKLTEVEAFGGKG